MDIRTILDGLAQEIYEKKFKNINEGGCGFFASVVAREMQQYNIPYEIKIVCGFHNEYAFDENMDIHDIFHSEIWHVLLSFHDGTNQFCFDSDGIKEYAKCRTKTKGWDYLDAYISKDYVSLKLLCKINKWYNWNTVYDTNQNERLRLTVKRYLRKAISNTSLQINDY